MLLPQTNPVTPPPKVLPQPDVFMLRKNVRRVIVDVTVRDSDGKPVHGLAAKDFSVSEDGQPQHVLTFEAHALDSPSLSLPANASLPPNVFVNVPKTPERGPLYVILYDMVNMDTDDQVYARQQALKFIRSKPAGTRFEIYVHSDGLHLVQGFTDDKDLIYSALDPQKPKPHVPRSFLMSRNFGLNDPVAMMSVFTHIAESLDGIPGRKNLIWVAGYFPLALYPKEGDPQDLRDDERREIDELSRAQIAVYPVSARGVVTNPEGALTGARPMGGATSAEQGMQSQAGGSAPSSAADAGANNSVSSPANHDASGVAMAGQLQGHGSSLTSDYMGMNDIAKATGGRAFYSDNGIKDMLDEAVEDGGNYYTLTYSPANLNYDGSVRKINVTLAKRGYHLSYRQSYYADDPNAPPVIRAKENAPVEDPEREQVKAQDRPIYANLQHGAPLIHQLIFKARVHASGAPSFATQAELANLASQPAFLKGNRSPKTLKAFEVQRYAIYYVVAANQIKASPNGPLPIEFAAVAFNSDGKVVNSVFEVAAGESFSTAAQMEAGDSPKQKVYRAMQELVVPVTATSIRIAVRDTLTDRVGSLEVTLPLTPEPEVSATTTVRDPAQTHPN